MTSPFTDRTRLVADAYADSGKLSARQSIYQFRRRGPDLHDRLIDVVDWSGADRVIDVGCGNAVYLERLRRRLPGSAVVIGMDLSEGMLCSAPHPMRVVADAQALPVASGSVDMVLALHMLYHVPDPAKAVREFRRVLRPGGVAVVATNGDRHLAELAALGDNRALRGDHVLGLDAARQVLAGVFASVDRYDFDDELIITDPQPLVDYVRSVISLGGDPAWAAALEDSIRARLEEQPFHLTVHPGVLIAQ